MLVVMMKVYKVFIIIIFTGITLCSLLSPSAAQEVNREELFEEMYLVVDYDEVGESESTTVSVYAPAFLATANDAPQLSNGKVAPNSGNSSTQFYFSVDYSDSNNDTPATIAVYIDATPSSMTLDSGSAYNGTYKSAAKTLSSGTHAYYFTATDGNGGSARLPATGSSSGPTVNDDPSLSEGEVTPGTGTSSTQFYYKVVYQDPDKDSPAEVYVYIDGTASYLTLDTGLVHQGTYKSSAQMFDSGTHEYYFTATDGKGGSVRLPVSESFSGPKINDPPQLSSGEVVPDSGNNTTDFYYYVDCYDKEGDIPETSYVYIDNVAYEMSLYSGESYNGTYRYGPKLLEAGSHDFYFSFTDGYSNTGRLPVEGSFSGPTVNQPPQLSGGKVVPDMGSGSTDFYYYIDYYDGEGDIPEAGYVYIDDVAYEMSSYSGKGYDGTYRYGPKLFKTGSHSFYFSFTDGYNDVARRPLEGSFSGPEMVSGSIYIYDNIGGADIILDDSNSGYTTPATLSPVDMGIHKVALLKNDYVSFPPYAVVEVVQVQTVEAPFILLPCPAVITLEDETDHLDLLRNFRDSVLDQTESGREYIDLYYRYALEISILIMNDSEVKTRVEKLLNQFIPILRLLMEGERVIFPSEIKAEIELLFGDFEAKGSPFLKAAMKKARRDLNKGEIIEQVGFEIEGGSF